MASDGERIWEDVVLSMLAVGGGYPLDRVVRLRERLRQQGLLSPATLAAWDVERVTVGLKHAGYDRGALTEMYADRLVSLGKQFLRGNTATAEQILLSGTEEEIRELLLPWHGIGPKVLDNLFALRRQSATPQG